MPWGTSSAVSTPPATRSLTSHPRWYSRRARTPGGVTATTASGRQQGAAAVPPAVELAHPLLDQDRDEGLHRGAGERGQRTLDPPADDVRVVAELRLQPRDERLDERPGPPERAGGRPVVGDDGRGHGHLAPPHPHVCSSHGPDSVAGSPVTEHHP